MSSCLWCEKRMNCTLYKDWLCNPYDRRDPQFMGQAGCIEGIEDESETDK